MLDFIFGPLQKDAYDTKKKDKYKMLELLGKLIKRLNELNDDSFEVDDRETERVTNL